MNALERRTRDLARCAQVVPRQWFSGQDDSMKIEYVGKPNLPAVRAAKCNFRLKQEKAPRAVIVSRRHMARAGHAMRLIVP